MPASFARGKNAQRLLPSDAQHVCANQIPNTKLFFNYLAGQSGCVIVCGGDAGYDVQLQLAGLSGMQLQELRGVASLPLRQRRRASAEQRPVLSRSPHFRLRVRPLTK